MDALVALLIVGLSALSLAGVQGLLWLNGETAQARDQALRIATSRLDAIRNQPAFNGGPATPQTLEVAGTRFVVLERASANTHAPFMTVAVEVQWIGRAGRHEEVSLNTVVPLASHTALRSD